MRRALLIANGRYSATSGFRQLMGPQHDVEALARVLGNEGPGGFEVTPLVDANKSAIVDAVTALMESAKPDDLILVHYSGHGMPGRKRDLYLAASDSDTDALLSTAVPVITIWAAARDSRCERFIFIFDCCFSGAALRAWTRGEADTNLRQLGEESGEGTHVIASSSELNTSEEREIGPEGIRMGLLTHAIVAAIEDGNGANKKGEISVASLLTCLKEELSEQRPKYYGSGDPNQIILARNARRVSIANQDRLKVIAQWEADGVITQAARLKLSQVLEVHRGASDLDLPEITRIVSLLDVRPPQPDAVLAMLHLTFPEAAADPIPEHSRRNEHEVSPTPLPFRRQHQRSVTPLSALGSLSRREDTADSFLQLVGAVGGVVPELAPIRYNRMMLGPATFFRGALPLMAEDLKAGPNSGLLVQGVGDCTLWNFATFPTADGGLVFDVSDFSQTAEMPFEFDLKRLAVSFVLAGKVSGIRKNKVVRLAERMLREYYERIHRLALAGEIAALRSRVDIAAEITKIKGKSTRQVARKWLDEVSQRENQGSKLIRLSKDRTRFVDRVPLLARCDDDARWTHSARKAFDKYRDQLGDGRSVLLDGYELSDVAFRVVGIGSVGLANFLGLFVNSDKQPLILELRQAEPPVFANSTSAESGGDAARIVRGQQVIQSVPDRFLAPVILSGEPEFYVRRLSGGRLDLLHMTVANDWLPFLARLCARTLASAHARSGQASALASYLTDVDAFVGVIAGFAMDYSAQVESDWVRFRTAVQAGSLIQPMPQSEPSFADHETATASSVSQ